MKIFALSDLHADYDQNLAWIHSLSAQKYQQDILILAGDVSDRLDVIEEVLGALQNCFAQVCFVPGNHELWVDKGDINCSLEKFHAVQDLCDRLGVNTSVYRGAGVSIVPLFSWYDFSFGEPDRYLRRAWRDFRACRWPDRLAGSNAVSDYFLGLNKQRLGVRDQTVISFSHFLPSLSVMPARIPPARRRVYPVLGSERLGEQLQQLQPDIHVYGHSHVNQSIAIGGIRYVNNAFAYPRESRIARKALYCVWESNTK